MTHDQAEAVRAGRRRLLLLLAVFLAPIAIAAAWYFYAPYLATSSAAVHGTLIDPARPLEPFTVERAGGEPFTLEDLRGRWTILLATGDRCAERCRRRVHDTRQVHAALGEDRARVQRVALAGQGRATPGLAGMVDEHPRLTVLPSGAARALGDQLPEAPAGTVFLVDPLGNLMLRFGPRVAPDDILADLERLLKVSRIG